MKAEFKVNVAAIIILGVAVAFFFLLRGNQSNQADVYINSLEEYEFEFEKYKSEVDSAYITWQKALNISNESLKAALANDSIQEELIAKYKKLSNVIKIETKFVHDTIKVSVPIYIKDDTTVNLADNCFKADLSLTNGLITLSGLTINNTQDIVIGDRRTGLFNTDQYISIRNSNPCITVTGMQTYTIVYEKKWWENPLITVPIGAAIGLFGSQLIK